MPKLRIKHIALNILSVVVEAASAYGCALLFMRLLFDYIYLRSVGCCDGWEDVGAAATSFMFGVPLGIGIGISVSGLIILALTRRLSRFFNGLVGLVIAGLLAVVSFLVLVASEVGTIILYLSPVICAIGFTIGVERQPSALSLPAE